MSNHRIVKRTDALEGATKKPKPLGALVAAVGAGAIGLLGMLPSASANTNNTPSIAVGIATSRPKAAKAKLRFNGIGSQLQIAGGGGHESHASHDSHASHASHSSGGYR